MVSTEEPDGVTGLAPNEQVALLGQATVRFTELLKPFSAAREIVEVFDLPCVTENEVGLAEMEKSGTTTLTVNVVVWVRLESTLSTPCTVTV